jgi:hypothetical protein
VPVRGQLRILDSSSTAADGLYHQMNLFRLWEALGRPEGLPASFFAGSWILVFAYFFFLLFAIGGVLETLVTDHTPTLGDFLRSSADFFWRMVRLLLVFAVLIAPIAAAQGVTDPLNEWIGKHSASEQLGFWVTLAIVSILGLLALAVRIWIDIAQIDCVAHGRAAVRHSLSSARQLLRGNFSRVYAAMVAVQMLLFGVTFLLLWVWVKLPHEAIGRTFMLGELIVLLWLGFRLWQKAVETAWYRRRVLALETPTVAAVDVSPDPPVVYDLPSQ